MVDGSFIHHSGGRFSRRVDDDGFLTTMPRARARCLSFAMLLFIISCRSQTAAESHWTMDVQYVEHYYFIIIDHYYKLCKQIARSL